MAVWDLLVKREELSCHRDGRWQVGKESGECVRHYI